MQHAMRFRPGHLALLLFQAIWLNVIVPGHTRGVVALPGADCQACDAAAASLPTRASCCDSSPTRSQRQTPNPSGRASRCAVCAFAARLTVPPVIDLTPPALGFLERL